MNTIGGVFGSFDEFKVFAGDHFIELDVATREFVDELGGGFGQDLVIVGIAVVSVPSTKELLIDVIRILASSKAFLIGRRDPITRGIGSVDFIDETNDTVFVLTEFVLGIHENQTVLVGHLLAKSEQFLGLGAAVVPVFLGHEASLDHVFGRDQFIVNIGLGGGGDQVLPQLLVLLQAFGEVDTAVLADAVVVVRPERGGGRAGDVASHDELDGEGSALAADGDVGVGDGEDVIGDDVLGVLEPPGRSQVQDLALEGNSAEFTVETRHTIGGDQDDLIATFKTIADLAFVEVLGVNASEIGLGEGVG